MIETFDIAGYARISVDDEQEQKNISIENQKAIIEDYVKTHFPGSTLMFFEDRDRSGYTFEQREGYQEMRRACLRRCAGRTIRREGRAAWALVTGHGARYRQPHHRAVNGNQSIEQKKGETIRLRPFSPIFTIYLTNCVLPISRDTNLTPKCSHSLQQFRCVLLLRTENVNVCVEIFAWPSHLLTTLIGTPAFSVRVAKVCRS